MLASTLGPGKAKVKVNADLNVDKTTAEGAHVRRQGRAAEATEENETMKGGAATAGGTAGTGSNVPTYSATAAAAAPRQRQLQVARRAHQLRRQQEGHQDRDGSRRGQQAQRRPAGRQVGPEAGLRLAAEDGGRGRRPRHDARRHDHRDADGLRQGRRRPRRARCRRRCSVRSSGSASASPPALPLLHDPRDEEAREREPRHAGLADDDRGADVAGAARGRARRPTTSTPPPTRCCPRACRTPACISSTS